MKEGRDLNALIAEVLRQAETKRDYLAPAKTLGFTVRDDAPTIDVFDRAGVASFPMRDTAHQQLAERLDIPKAYYDRMKDEAPFLFGTTVKYWLQVSERKYLIRTLDGQARAVLSDRYRMLDNDDLASAALPVLNDHGFRIVSCELTERKFYLKAITEKIQGEVRKGDVVQAGIVISNSEIGQGTLKIEPLLYFLACTNGLMVPDASMRRQHVGRGLGELEQAERYYRDETREADDAAFWMKVRDVLRGMLTEPAFAAHLDKLRGAAEQPITSDPVEVIDLTAKKYRLTEGERNGVLKAFLSGHNGRVEMNRYGLVQAITRASQDIDDYDRATDLEQLGGQVLELPAPQWKQLAEARA